MSQRTVFPSIPNTAEGAYIPVLQAIFGELANRGGAVKFKEVRSWLKERNIYNKEEVEELFAFVGCEWKPMTTMGDFAKKFISCNTPEGQQETLLRWVDAWNPILTKYVYEALDVEGGGRLHSTHELYRMVTSYVYPGDYVTLVNFQTWIKWMAATGYIKYIGIRWGLSDRGKAEMKRIRNFDVDEWLEDKEEEEAEAAEAADALANAPAEVGAAESEDASPAGDGDDELPPDMPPEAPIPVWDPPEADEATGDEATGDEATAKETPAKGASKAPARKSSKARTKAAKPATPPPLTPEVAAPTSVNAGTLDAGQLGLDPKDYGKNPSLFLLNMAVAARLATHTTADWRPFFKELVKTNALGRYFSEDQPLATLLHDAGWFGAHSELLRLAVVDVMRVTAALKADRALTTTLEECGSIGQVVWLLHMRFYGGELTAAPFWLARAMIALELWDNPSVA